MFTGIIEAVGHIAAIENKGVDRKLKIATGKLDLTSVHLGDSIAVNGVCLTAVALPGDGFVADVSSETLTRTTLGKLKVGDRTNLERALTPTTRLGGHLVSGHVDGVGEVKSISQDGRSLRITVRAPDTLAKYIAEKGSICIDGISLTVNAVRGAEFDLNIVPHTVSETCIGSYQLGTQLNLEVDVIARYLERLLLGDKAAEPNGSAVTMEFLAQHGFAR